MSTYYPDAAKRFAVDTKKHAMTVLHDDGLYRHIRFQTPGTGMYWFDLVTWPGCLTIRGDMGTFTFARVDDMFEFFTAGGDINPQYWAEKLLGGRDDIRVYNASTFRWMVGEAYQEHREQDPTAKHLPALWQALRADVLVDADAGQDAAIAAAMSFSFPYGPDVAGRGGRAGREFTLGDAWEWEVTDFSIFYLWCCLAVRWGVQQYHAQKTGQPVPA